jgi:hypothetical protein
MPDVAPANQPMVNECSYLVILARGLHHETAPPHVRADHPQAQNGRSVQCPVQDLRRHMPSSGCLTAHLPGRVSAVCRHEGSRCQTPHPAREGNPTSQEACLRCRSVEGYAQGPTLPEPMAFGALYSCSQQVFSLRNAESFIIIMDPQGASPPVAL